MADRLTVDLDFFGLTPLADPEDNAAVDIIAVTGLAGHAFESWKSRGYQDMWLRDFLPESIPNARILTYGYDTKLPGSQSNASIVELSRRLLESIKTTRDAARQIRPLILIGHGLGGLVVKQALVQAFEGDLGDEAVFMSCYAVVFFAVPNRGLDNRSLMTMVKGQPNEDLVRNLSGDSAFSRLLHERFYSLFGLNGSRIISVFETLTTPTVEWSWKTTAWERTGPSVMIVPHTSAIYAGSNEKHFDQLSINANHSDIVKFSDQSDQNYSIIERKIKELVAAGLDVIEERFTSHIREAKSKILHQGRSWFLKDERLRAWQVNDKSSILRIEGSAGRGKTILTKLILTHLEQLSPNPSSPALVIYFFFYNQDDNYRTVSAALRSLIKQLLSVRGAFQIISHSADIENSAMTEDYLWGILEDLLRAPVFNTIYCIIDALDECHDRHRLLAFIKKLVQPPTSARGRFPVLKVLAVSRPMVELSRELDQFPVIQLKANPHDLEIFIRREVGALKLDVELHEKAIELLIGRAEQTFLWISIVMKRLRTTTALLSRASLTQIISETPSDPTQLYEDIIGKIIKDKDMAAQKLLMWVAFSRRALSLEELEEALAIQEDSNSKAYTEQYTIRLTDYAVRNTVGVILEITADNKVYLIHQSAKDFLLKSGHLASVEFCRGLLPGVYLAKMCMTNLCFKDFETGCCRNPASLQERNHRHPLLRYAARNWHHHIGAEDNAKKLTKLVYQLTEPRSPALLTWGEAAGIEDLDKAANTWDVAIKADIPWLAEFQLRGDVITEEMVKKAAGRGLAGWDSRERLIRNCDNHFGERAVLAIVQHFDRVMVRLLLDNHGPVVASHALLSAATINRQYGGLVMGLLLDSRYTIVVTTNIVELAETNKVSGSDVLKLLLRHSSVHFPEDAVAMVAARFGPEMMKIWLSSNEDIKVTEMIFEAAMGNRLSGGEISTLLLEHQHQAFQITKEAVNTIATQFGRGTMAALLENRGQDVHITEEVMRAAAGNRQNGREVMGVLLDHRGDEIIITEEVMKTAAENEFRGREVMGVLLDRRGDEIIITEEVIEAAAANKHCGREVIELLLDRHGDKITITEEVIQAAAASKNYGKEVMELLLDRRGDEIIITEEVIKAAAANELHGKKVLELLLDRREVETLSSITEEIIFIAARCGQVGVLDLVSRQSCLASVQNEWRCIAKFYNAAKSGDVRCIEQLIRDGTKPDTKNIKGETPLWAAAFWGRDNVVKVLAPRLDVNVNSLSISGRSPLFWPSVYGNERVVAVLMEAGADPHIADENGDTAITLARQYRKKVVKMLEQ
ncbi:hypothetical protein QQS21_011558 [Conoideocrella luteorostrata]|uniref:NACHT domain-containing protein n=1 Tax=Conoideocrella luteorostrata TaxID=1105319 RepID=A0AAJ0CD44_9HYPO|nr:hypothetical protein QQS21_011558 [Conoideocrella luteorostrata]